MTPDPEAIAARYFECGSVRKVAREFGLTRAVVCTRLRWMGVPEGVAVPTREPAAPPPLFLSPAAAKALYEQGRSPRSLAREFGLHPQTVRRRLKAAGVALTQTWPAGTDAPLMWRLLALNRAGLSLAAMARMCRCSAQTVARYLDAAGVERSRQRPRGWDKRQEIAACLVAGLSLRKTARRLGLGTSTVWRAKEALGLGYTGGPR